MNSKNSKTSNHHRSLLNLPNKINLKRSDRCCCTKSLYTWKNIKRSPKDNEFKISAPTWNKNFEIPDMSCSVSKIQDYFDYFDYLNPIQDGLIFHGIIFPTLV